MKFLKQIIVKTSNDLNPTLRALKIFNLIGENCNPYFSINNDNRLGDCYYISAYGIQISKYLSLKDAEKLYEIICTRISNAVEISSEVEYIDVNTLEKAYL
jgi:hypothetical protein